MIGQLQVLDLSDLDEARAALLCHKDELLAAANRVDPTLVGLGGGARDVEVRLIHESGAGPMLVVHMIVDTRDAMGANAVNSAVEALAPLVERLTGGRVLLRILSNLADRRLARAECRVPASALTVVSDGHTFEGHQVVDRIVEACALAVADPYRAATHNKGIMNGVDAVVLATGNDWRAVEAGAHAYAARHGRYASLSEWHRTPDGELAGWLEMPMPVGVVGGATRVHPLPRVALKLLGVQTARQLAEIIVAVGLAQNLAALRALATEGIQRGHMRLHARQVAMAAGASGDQIDEVAAQLVRERAIRLERAQEIVRHEAVE
jgi:hydroxymethylglutaryl-CoA reductase